MYYSIKNLPSRQLHKVKQLHRDVQTIRNGHNIIDIKHRFVKA